jgi:glycosyltransferase involved in cell wall biosynthesis
LRITIKSERARKSPLPFARCQSLNSAIFKRVYAAGNRQLSSDEVADLYQSSSALIYPSKTESFGLPLIEAAQYKLPILAAELDYVRDVVVPVETFDPNSPVSIARAVRRFLGNAEPTIQIHSAEEFLEEVFR